MSTGRRSVTVFTVNVALVSIYRLCDSESPTREPLRRVARIRYEAACSSLVYCASRSDSASFDHDIREASHFATSPLEASSVLPRPPARSSPVLAIARALPGLLESFAEVAWLDASGCMCKYLEQSRCGATLPYDWVTPPSQQASLRAAFGLQPIIVRQLLHSFAEVVRGAGSSHRDSEAADPERKLVGVRTVVYIRSTHNVLMVHFRRRDPAKQRRALARKARQALKFEIQAFEIENVCDPGRHH
ncbi:hypothetical protein OH77DRAFT_1436490 [Trametes cingulata]|nr:hypothetical protein OH77DRAFT_1436490 [Trametes cingulata]